MFKNILFYMICGLGKIRSVHTYVIPWIHWFEQKCSCIPFFDRLYNVPSIVLIFSRQYPLTSCYLDPETLKMIMFAHYQKTSRNGCFFGNSTNENEEYDKPTRNGYNKTEFWSFYGPLLALVLCLVILIILIRKRLRKNVSKVKEETRSAIDIISVKTKSSIPQEENWLNWQ